MRRKPLDHSVSAIARMPVEGGGGGGLGVPTVRRPGSHNPYEGKMPPPVPQQKPPPRPPQWELPENIIPRGHPVEQAGQAYSRGVISGPQFKNILKKHGYKADLRQRDSNIMEVLGPDGYKFLEF